MMYNERTRLASLERAIPSPEAEHRAFERMLSELDGVAIADDTAEVQVAGAARVAGVAEIGVIAQRRDPRTFLPPVVLAVAAAVISLILVTVSLSDTEAPSDTIDDVAADPATIVDGTADDGGGAQPGPGTAPAPDDDLPRLVRGRFESKQLGWDVSLFAREPMWLVRHEAGLIEFTTSLDYPTARLVIAAPSAPTPELAVSDNLESYLRNSDRLGGGQISRVTIDEVNSLYWRSSVPFSGDDCMTGEPCLVLYDEPVRIGIEDIAGVTDIAERPMPDSTKVIIIGSLPFDQFSIGLFGQFNEVVESLTFDELGQGIVTG